MAQFQIKKGLSKNLFDGEGKLLITPEEGCWYITTDTFELYAYFDGVFEAVGAVQDFESRFEALETQIAQIHKTVGYLSSLPIPGEPNTIYTIIDENAQYRWDEVSQKYYCMGRDYNEISVIYGGEA